MALVDGVITLAADEDVDEEADVELEDEDPPEAVELLDAPELQGGLTDETNAPTPRVEDGPLHHCS